MLLEHGTNDERDRIQDRYRVRQHLFQFLLSLRADGLPVTRLMQIVNTRKLRPKCVSIGLLYDD